MKKRAKKLAAPPVLEEIARQLARRWMVRPDGLCVGCGRTFAVPAGDIDAGREILRRLADPHEHPECCPWARARKWCAENPA